LQDNRFIVTVCILWAAALIAFGVVSHLAQKDIDKQKGEIIQTR